MKTIDLIIPCYNEEDNIQGLFKKIHLLFDISTKYSKFKLKICLIENGSTDNTRQEILKNIKNFKFSKKIKLIRIKKNNGYGYGIIKGVENSNADFIAWTHSDLQTDPLDLINFIEILNFSNKENLNKLVIKGKRINRKPISAIITFLMTVITFIFTLKYVPDANAQPKLFSSSLKDDFLNKAPFDLTLDLHLLLIAKKFNYNLQNVNVRFKKRLGSKAKGAGSIKGLFLVTFSIFIYLIKSLMIK